MGCPRFRYDHGWKKRGEKSKFSDRDKDAGATDGDTIASKDGRNQRRKDGNEDIKSTTSSESSGDDRKTLSMFHVVFIMNPPLLEHNIRIKEMYEFVVWRLSKKLKQQQAKSDWVWRESETILTIKEKAKEERKSLLSSPFPTPCHTNPPMANVV